MKDINSRIKSFSRANHLNGKHVGAVYEITNTVNGHGYIGSSMKVKDRLIQHFGDLKRGKHANERLQNDYNLHGADGFQFGIIYRHCFRKPTKKDPRRWLKAKYELSYIEKATINHIQPFYNFVHKNIGKSGENSPKTPNREFAPF